MEELLKREPLEDVVESEGRQVRNVVYVHVSGECDLAEGMRAWHVGRAGNGLGQGLHLSRIQQETLCPKCFAAGALHGGPPAAHADEHPDCRMPTVRIRSPI